MNAEAAPHIEFRSDVTVELVRASAHDADVVFAARVSTVGEASIEDIDADAERSAGLIRYLMRERHGSPFEHNSMTFRISAPIFVFREFMRHRIGFSYNEVSGRYKKLDPKFFIYPPERPLVQEGSSAHPDLVAGDSTLTLQTNECLEGAYEVTWKAYEDMLELGVANEVARAVLPVGIYSDMYVTCNARSLMSFMSLRIDAANAAFETKPQWEIEQVALVMEESFKELFPATWSAYDKNGRVAP